MCGIHAATSQTPPDSISGSFKTCLCNRGPDHLGRATITLRDENAELHVALTSTVLALRGSHITAQPLIDDASGSVLCWNGEAWKIQDQPVEGNDGELVLSKLTEAGAHGQDAILDMLRAIEGPFAFIFVDKPSQTMYYGRDRLGRRSLLVNPNAPFQLSSISDVSTGWEEVEADGCYTLSLEPKNFSAEKPLRHEWDSNEELVSKSSLFSGSQFNKS